MLPYFTVGTIHVFSYPLVLGLLFGFSFVYSRFLLELRNESLPFYPIYFLGCILFSWFGAKIFFLLSVDVELATRAAVNENFWLGGGFVFYGGLITGALFTVCYGVITKISIKRFEFLIPVLLLSHGIGRLGCFLAGCCYGTHSDLPWALDSINDGSLRHPTQLYEALILFLGHIIFLKRYRGKKPIILNYLLFYSITRFVLEFFRGDHIRGVYWYGVSTSQIISSCIFASFLLFYTVNKMRDNA